ncbi:hydroxyproline dehydrogenase-like [Penaeus japonicus]|uniref:hydroxyproline dehydrogenase-like n=1 Tax=Penaeus japonicus TaxID=27405 RepID=UPI001C714EF4|nr:hydroxyproline dehydrogenase-like [Penaeus japonicus]XP_042867461.1 hydroxyproline dehydrogenase-like [Penaeus japonicus]
MSAMARVLPWIRPVRTLALRNTCAAPLLARSAHVTGSAPSSASVNIEAAMGKQSFAESLAEQLNFGNHAFAYSHKTSKELLRGLVVLHACAIDTLVNHSYKLLTVGERMLGEKLLGYAVAPFYNQFVAGDSEEEMALVSRNLAGVGVRLMVAPMLETDVGEGHDLESMYRKNLDKTLHLIDVSRRNSALQDSRPICQTKMTAHLSADTLARVSAAYEGLSEAGRLEAVRALAKAMQEAGEGRSRTLSPLTHPLQPLSLSSEDIQDVLDSLARIYKLGERSVAQDVVLAVDAEYTYTNPAINLLTLAMMKIFNTPTPIVWNTYQGYLKAGRENLDHDLRLARGLGGVGFGAKVVRGAYLERERSRARELGYSDPVNDTYKDTGLVYDSMVELMLREIKASPHSRSVIVASHNEASVRTAARKLEELELDPLAGNVVFGQVYGMAENISVPLARSGFLVYKSVPYGSVAEVMPYLSRRANENRAVLKGARRERQLLTQELLSRIFPSRSTPPLQ